jgi:hypothetical protein
MSRGGGVAQPGFGCQNLVFEMGIHHMKMRLASRVRSFEREFKAIFFFFFFFFLDGSTVH